MWIRKETIRFEGYIIATVIYPSSRMFIKRLYDKITINLSKVITFLLNKETGKSADSIDNDLNRREIDRKLVS